MNRHSIVLAILLSILASLVAGLNIGVGAVDRALIASVGALFALFVPFFLFGLSDFLRGSLSRPASLALVLVALLLPCLVYFAGTSDYRPTSFIGLVAFMGVPTALVLLARRRPAPVLWDVLAVLAIWLPFDFRLLDGIWSWPEGRASYGLSVVLAVDLALVLFVAYRATPGVGYRFRLGLRDSAIVLGCFLVFSALAIPLGLGIEFIEYTARPFDLLGLLGSFAAILIFIAVPEELLFRGLIQNFLERTWRRDLLALVVAAAIFGAAHLNNGEVPNWSYALMATLAGLFYGLAYRWTGTIFASALVHALVNAVWRAFFR
ncbi:MAG TPA: type II CAAX endopeptidase family protein [Vicinamibacteria bacterium]|nr:type II CAAX endopeptidase family protein [Vicinamibacteria bacterium]